MTRFGPAILFVYSIVQQDRASLYFAIGGCALSSLVAVFQFAVFTSFLKAAYVVIDYIDADVWIMERGVESFDFPYPISRDYSELTIRCFSSARVSRVLFGFTTWQSPTGRHGNVAIVGYEGASIFPRSFIADRSDFKRLELGFGRQAEIGEITMYYEDTTDKLATFLGAPYIITDFHSAANALSIQRDRASFLVVFSSLEETMIATSVNCARKIVPELTVMTATEFAKSSAKYWLLKTGAGAAILLAALLATILNLLILVNGITRFMQRHHSSLLSIIGHGGNFRTISAAVFFVSLIIVGVGISLALILLPIADLATDSFVPWVSLKKIDFVFALGVSFVALFFGYLVSRRETQKIDVGEIFRV